MARITVEDCLKKVENRFELIHLAAKRVRQLRKGDERLVESKNTDIVVSLREIAAGKVFRVDDDDEQLLLTENQEEADGLEPPENAGEESSNDNQVVEEEASPEG